MDVAAATLTIPWGEAQSAYRHYRQAIKEQRATPTDVLIARAYHALLRGRKVIDLPRAMHGAGRWPAGHKWEALPKLAIARADWPQVEMRFLWPGQDQGRVIRFAREGTSWHGNTTHVDLPVQPFRDGLGAEPSRRAIVPMIPPQFRPKGSHLSTDGLKEWWLLFEADWGNAPVDPLLLKHLGGPFYVVLAAWDLSPVEQAVLRMRT